MMLLDRRQGLLAWSAIASSVSVGTSTELSCFLPLAHGQGSFGPIFRLVRTGPRTSSGSSDSRRR